MRSKNDRFPLVKQWGEEDNSTVNCTLQRVLLSCDALQRLRVLLRAAAAKCEVYRGDFHAEKGRDRKRRRNGF